MGYDDTVMDASKENRGIFERICLWIPGYRGYRQKNIRRDVDKEVRAQVARTIEESKTVLSTIQRGVVGSGTSRWRRPSRGSGSRPIPTSRT